LRLKGNRVLYCAPLPRRKHQRGPLPKHGRKVKLSDARTWGVPEVNFEWASDGDIVEVKIWRDRHMHSNPTVTGCLIQIRIFYPDATTPKFVRPMWLFWTGPADMDWIIFWRVYLKRYCLESVHQFSKNSLAWTRPRLGYTDREENWTQLVMLAYWQLLLAVPIANDARMPWQKPMPPGRLPTPARVQRDYFRIFTLIGTPVCAPRRRGISLGRPHGFRPQPRQRFPVVYKGSNTS
jgi:hypothetical protein